MLNGVKREWRTDDGGVWLMQGDCLEILPQLEANSIDMIWTDPPYGHGNADGDLLSRRAEAVGDGVASKQTPRAQTY